MNKKLSSLNQQFISNIHDKSSLTSGNKDLTARLEVREKEMMLENKVQLANSLRRQLQLEEITYNLLKLQS